jgi:FKBP-type peptidyl-prolyl cis-trans isomerase SlyD
VQVARNTVVTINYTVTDPDGAVLDTSDGDEPLSYIQGTDSLVPGLERALEGKSPTDRIAVTVSPEDGYGVRDDALVIALPRSQFTSVGAVEVGMQFEMQGEEDSRIVTVTSMDDDTVTVDANHPMAGVTLRFDVSIVGVRPATAEELEHGHAHGADGGHHHH